jgi:hypothetical protein
LARLAGSNAKRHAGIGPNGLAALGHLLHRLHAGEYLIDAFYAHAEILG